MKPRHRVWLEVGLVAAIFLAALFVRVYQLDLHPPGLYNDEAAYGMDGIAARAGDIQVFYPRNNGREPLFIYLLGAAFASIGATAYAIRLAAAVTGAVTVVTTYWMVRAMVRFAPEQHTQPPSWFAIWVALFLAFSYWHLSLSRVGFRAITLPLLLTIAFALFWVTWRRLRQPGAVPWTWAILTGAALGLTLYTYTAGRMSLVLFAAMVMATWLLAARFGIDRTRLLKSAAVITAAALIVTLPLLSFFVRHPEYFGAHAAEVSIFNPRYAGDNPLAALLTSVTRNLQMFFMTPDGNLRHNPAEIPVFDPLMALWLAAGIGLAVIRWRHLTTLFALLWFTALAIPAVLSAEGVPHSLRMIGMTPIVYLLPVMAMAWVSGLAQGRRRAWLRWLPLPFLLIAAAVSISSYFGAWTQPARFRAAFQTDYVMFARALAALDNAQAVWIMPLLSARALADGQFNTIDFFQDDPGAYATLVVDAATAPATLAQLTQDRRVVNVLRPGEVPDLDATSYIFSDPKGLLNLLLRRNSLGPARTGQTLAEMPYLAYDLLPASDFTVPDSTPLRTNVRFGDRFQLTGAAIGGGNRWFAQDGVLALPADAPIWAILRWESLAPVTSLHKTSLILRDAGGNQAGQVDELLVGDDFPNVLNWREGEIGSTYHVLELLPGLAPGRYTLELQVYEDGDGRILPPAVAGAAGGVFYRLATIDLAPPQQPGASVTPQFPLDSLPVNPQIIGFDLADSTAAPGDVVALTLYFYAPTTPVTTGTLTIGVYASDGTPVSTRTLIPGGDDYPPNQWRAGEIMRVPAALPIDPTTADGEYELRATITVTGTAPVVYELGKLEIFGREHIMVAPEVNAATAAQFDNAVQLIGVNAALPLRAAPGAALDLTLVWQPLRPEPRELVRFVQLLNSAGQLVAQQDTIPCGGGCPSTSWRAGEYLNDAATLPLPATLPAGSYRLITGWYDPASQQRLPAFDATGGRLPDDVVIIAEPVTVAD